METSEIVPVVMESLGIKNLFPPQRDALRRGILDGKNIVVATPTASGKTLIAIFAAVKTAMEGKKTLYLVPLRSIASEKYKELKESLERLDIKVAISTGDFEISPHWLSEYDLIVCTNERADSILRHNPSWLRDVGLLVVDEIHLISSEKRGPVVEFIITKMRKMLQNLQLICLSATISNAEELADWLDAELVKSNWRPVKLVEGVIYRHKIHWPTGIEKLEAKSGNEIVDLCVDVIKGGGQALVFLNTRRTAVRTAEKLKPYIAPLLSPNEKRALQEVANRVIALDSERTKLSELLSKLVASGVSFHHAGLRYEHREIIEEAFRRNLLKVICATPTLAAGVNLPARRVIIAQAYRYTHGRGSQPISTMEYKQMVGRAGRPKYDTLGEAIIRASSAEAVDRFIESYINSPPERITSNLLNSSILRSQTLSVVASGLALTKKDILDLYNLTLYAYQASSKRRLRRAVREALAFLVENGFLKQVDGSLYATELGRKISLLYLDPLTAKLLLTFLQNARASTTSSFLFLMAICLTPDMELLSLRRGAMREIDEILEDRVQELQLPAELIWESTGRDTFLQAVWTAAVLEMWINEVSEDELNFRYDVGPGDVRRLTETADWLLYSARELAMMINHREAIRHIDQLRLRVKYGVREELVELVSLTGIGRVRARNLYNHGFTSIDALKAATIEQLSRVPTIGLQLAKSIKAQVERTVDAVDEGSTYPIRDKPSELERWL